MLYLSTCIRFKGQWKFKRWMPWPTWQSLYLCHWSLRLHHHPPAVSHRCLQNTNYMYRYKKILKSHLNKAIKSWVFCEHWRRWHTWPIEKYSVYQNKHHTASDCWCVHILTEEIIKLRVTDTLIAFLILLIHLLFLLCFLCEIPLQNM